MVELGVCIGSSCHLKGSYNVIQTFQQLIEERKLHSSIEIKANFCMKQCANKGVTVAVNDRSFDVNPENAKSFFENEIIPLINS